MRIFLTLAFAMAAVSAPMHATAQSDAVNEYLRRLPYQETFNYMMQYTGGDPAKLNAWVAGREPVIFKAGEDVVVRMNNDTFYKQAFADLSEGPVVLTSENADPDRFSSFQLMDDRNVNFRNIIRPEGSYVMYYGERPEATEGELIEAPSKLVPVVVRIEVKDPHDAEDVARAEAVHSGIGISGPEISSIEPLDLLSEFDEETVRAAEAQMEEVMKTVPFREMVAGPGDVPEKVSYLLLAASAKHAWGGPVPSHSAYEAFFADENGDPLQGANGPYAITTAEPPVDAFWSVTVYDTATGRFFDNPDDRYHINNTMAEKNADGTVTFLFKTTCMETEVNCLYVPEGAFDISARYYLPDEAIQSGEWTMPKPRKIQ
ncbi:DUF1214 domain-containing protein [Defluviimonas sp. D31]|uniref:DUF1214 domain-containing protein n=1 Tax=Defluviimonas sp. D31 TaxID=3083253 RepID=UPI00296FF042|nr:DUF1214 domain-containing protein [Defluviimonas sp. D31]MDW4551712.1 DUF1214 domain-containing protein [Defluviimonas sp. D31]